MSTLFIADLHLSNCRPAITDCFLTFLEESAGRIEALYILGDLFEAWIGDDAAEPQQQVVATALKRFTDSGQPCYFTHGNRDFLVGDRFCIDTGVQILAEATVIDLYGEQVLLMHGDTLCTDDYRYQLFRRVMREYGVTKLVHGHTHRPAVHDFSLDQQPASRIVLGDWYTQGSFLEWNPGGFSLQSLPIE
jgi:UDP-2,3-diacylglucosamine hydrolase